MPRSRFHPFAATRPENLRTFSQNPSTFFPNPTTFRRPSPTLRNRLRHARRKPPFRPSLLTRALRALSHFSFFAFTLHPPRQYTHAQRIRGEGFIPFFLHPTLHPPHRSPPLNDRGQKWPKAVKTGAQGEAFTRNTLYFKRLCVNRSEHTRGEAFTRNTLTLNTLQTKGEEVKAKNRKTPDARVTRTRWAAAVRRPAPLVGRGRKNVPRRTALPRKNCNFAGCDSPLFTRKCTPSENVPV